MKYNLVKLEKAYISLENKINNLNLKNDYIRIKALFNKFINLREIRKGLKVKLT